MDRLTKLNNLIAQVNTRMQGNTSGGNMREDASVVEATKSAKYQLYHNSYTDAVNAGLQYAENLGFSYDPEETAQKIGLGSRKPDAGGTNRVSIGLFKNGQPQRKMLHMQVYGMGGENGKYELNAYIN